MAYALRGGGSYDIVSFQEAGLVVWWVLAIGVALGLLPGTRPAPVVLWGLAALAAYTAWTALSLTWTDSSELTFEEVARCLDYLGIAALASCVLDRASWRSAAAGLGAAAMFVCVVAVGCRLAPSLFGHDRVAAQLSSDRLSYPFGYWNAVAAWGAMCVALGLTWSAHDPSRLRRAIALGLVPVAGLTIYLTYSRAGVAGAVLAVIAALVLSRNRATAAIHAMVAAGGTALAIAAARHSYQIAHATGTHGAGTVLGALVGAGAACVVTALVTRGRVDAWRLPRRLFRPLAAIGVLAVLIAAGVAGPHLASRAWHSFKRVPAVAATGNPTARLDSLSGTRYAVWRSAEKAFQAHPGTGTGAGTFQFWWNQHGTTAEFLRDTHNIWLQNLAELGVPGLILIVAVMGGALALAVTARRRARRPRSAGVAAALLAVFVVYLLHASVDWMWESTSVTVLALAGVFVLGARLGGRRPRLIVPFRAALALAAAAAGIAQLPGILSTTAIRHSQAAERAGNAGAALAWADRAVSAEPWSASAYEQRGLVLESGGRLREAKHNLRQAISHEPDNYAHWLLLARIETELRQLGPAEQAYARAHQLRPESSVFQLAPYFTTGASP